MGKIEDCVCCVLIGEIEFFFLWFIDVVIMGCQSFVYFVYIECCSQIDYDFFKVFLLVQVGVFCSFDIEVVLWFWSLNNFCFCYF